MSEILITGGAGNFGRGLAEALREQGHALRILDLPAESHQTPSIPIGDSERIVYKPYFRSPRCTAAQAYYSQNPTLGGGSRFKEPYFRVGSANNTVVTLFALNYYFFAGY